MLEKGEIDGKGSFSSLDKEIIKDKLASSDQLDKFAEPPRMTDNICCTIYALLGT